MDKITTKSHFFLTIFLSLVMWREGGRGGGGGGGRRGGAITGVLGLSSSSSSSSSFSSSPSSSPSSSSCDVSEYACDNGKCVALSFFCDGQAQCSDYSDEPPGCSVCNRTYYGNLDHTYQVEVPAPPASRAGPPASARHAHPLLLLGGTPSESFKCVLTLTALGGHHGEMLQVTFSEFHVGHFNVASAAEGGDMGGVGGGMSNLAGLTGGKRDGGKGGAGEKSKGGTEGGGGVLGEGIKHVGGCEGDHVTIEEPKLVERGGRWCGEGSGLNVYFSETNSVVVTLHAAATTQGEYFDNPLRFKIKYKFLPRARAEVRYGRGGAKYRGDEVRNSVCSRVFQGCRARRCRLQSPNYPGLYPRNVTCYYLVKALPPPAPNLLPLVTLSQPNDRLVHVGRQGLGGRVSPEARLRQDGECRAPEDFLLVYDGGSMKAPLLARLCGTASLPNITSSGPEMLVVFQAATSGLMNHLPNLVAGFELQAHVVFMREAAGRIPNSVCDYVLQSDGGSRGIVSSPVFALPANSSCAYHFEGRRDEVVWLYFTKYHRAGASNNRPNHSPCRNRLAIHDGDSNADDGTAVHLMGEFCDDQLPPTCVRARQRGLVSQPCGHEESFLSSGSSILVTQSFTDSTALLPLHYVIHYEFVSVAEAGHQPGTDCDQTFNSEHSRNGHFRSPENVFLYGRGGKASLSCRYSFTQRPGEVVTVRVTSLGFRGNMCKTVHNTQSELYECIARLPGSAVLEAWEEPWPFTCLPLGCLCDASAAPATFRSHAPRVQLRFAIKDMSWAQDYSDFFFEAEYEFESVSACGGAHVLNGSTGAIVVGDSSAACQQQPWKIVAREASHLYLHVPGYHAASQRCVTHNRVVVYGSHKSKPIKSVCPDATATHGVHVFSSGWTALLDYGEPLPDSLIIRYLAREPATYRLTWLEVRREPRPSALESHKGGRGRERPASPASCPHLCPQIDACISSDLWCDGARHCPSGADETSSTCLYLSVPWLYVGVASAGLGVVLLVVAAALVSVRVYRRGKVKRKKKKEAQRLMTREVILPLNFHKDIY